MFRSGTGIRGANGIVTRESPHSKPRIAIKLGYQSQLYSIVYGRFADGSISEVLIDGFADEAARLVTLLLQRGVEIETVRRSITDGLMGAILDRLMMITTGGPRSAAYRWLQHVERRQTMNRRRSTQMFKHWAEADEGEYVSVADFHTAALALGFMLQWIPNTPNAWINIAEPHKSKRSHRR